MCLFLSHREVLWDWRWEPPLNGYRDRIQLLSTRFNSPLSDAISRDIRTPLSESRYLKAATWTAGHNEHPRTRTVSGTGDSIFSLCVRLQIKAKCVYIFVRRFKLKLTDCLRYENSSSVIEVQCGSASHLDIQLLGILFSTFSWRTPPNTLKIPVLEFAGNNVTAKSEWQHKMVYAVPNSL